MSIQTAAAGAPWKMVRRDLPRRSDEGAKAAGWPTWIGVVAQDLEGQRRFWGDLLGLPVAGSGSDYVDFDGASLGPELWRIMPTGLVRPTPASKEEGAGWAPRFKSSLREQRSTRRDSGRSNHRQHGQWGGTPARSIRFVTGSETGAGIRHALAAGMLGRGAAWERMLLELRAEIPKGRESSVGSDPDGSTGP